ncbi:hypothetical protein BDV95DRAFT_605816 [Massariosphaeria phaeospora]|uniref:Integral membrane protein-like protein n=1 Tax=Massariosphaeria phaeospora TaxID=100035 RepID=A0A7C8MAY5_9PLEO|nr:hypothetical protein BDV95DRAFT_605816 [Massariosphaeria phaeospora]
MPSALVSQTLQGAVLSMTSNILAQAISSYRDDKPFALNISPVLKFAIFSIISSPPNIVWQSYLEDLFPTNVPASAPLKEKPAPASKASHTQLSKRNVLIKFLLDQTIGAVVNTLLFLVFMGYVNAPQTAKQGTWNIVGQEVKDKLYPMLKDGYKFWPAVSLTSFLWVPVDKRVVFGCAVGVFWGIYLSLAVGA